MAARDKHHQSLAEALRRDGWTITHDPLVIGYYSRDILIDIGADRDTLSADKDGRKIAVEVKTFGTPSPVTDLQKAVGQYDMYELVLAEFDPSRSIYLAISDKTYRGIFQEKLGQLMVDKRKIRLIIFDEINADILQWIN